MLFYSFFKTLVGKTIVVELKNDVCLEGTLHSVDQFLNLKLENLSLADPKNLTINNSSIINVKGIKKDDNNNSLTFKYPHLASIDRAFIRGSVVRYVHLPAGQVDVELLQDATRRESESK